MELLIGGNMELLIDGNMELLIDGNMELLIDGNMELLIDGKDNEVKSEVLEKKPDSPMFQWCETVDDYLACKEFYNHSMMNVAEALGIGEGSLSMCDNGSDSFID